jgi:hypothetical protein
MKNIVLPPALLLVLCVLFVIAPAITPPFMGYDADQFPVAITRHFIQPAGYAFSIWGVIYLWLIIHAAFGLIKRSGHADWAAPRWPLIGAVALGTVWLAIASTWPILATVTISVMAICALWAFLRAAPQTDRWLLIAPLAIFAGWLTAATLVSLGVILAGYGGLSNAAAAYAMLAVAVLLGMALQARQPTMPFYSATLVWALVAVNRVNSVEMPAIATAALAAAALTALGGAALWWRSRT